MKPPIDREIPAGPPDIPKLLAVAKECELTVAIQAADCDRPLGAIVRSGPRRGARIGPF